MKAGQHYVSLFVMCCMWDCKSVKYEPNLHETALGCLNYTIRYTIFYLNAIPTWWNYTFVNVSQQRWQKHYLPKWVSSHFRWTAETEELSFTCNLRLTRHPSVIMTSQPEHDGVLSRQWCWWAGRAFRIIHMVLNFQCEVHIYVGH